MTILLIIGVILGIITQFSNAIHSKNLNFAEILIETEKKNMKNLYFCKIKPTTLYVPGTSHGSGTLKSESPYKLSPE